MNSETIKRMSKERFVLEIVKDITSLQNDVISFDTKQNVNAVIDALAAIMAQSENILNYLSNFDDNKLVALKSRLDKAIEIRKNEINIKIKRAKGNA